jgi:hypothetical protein
MDGETRFKRPRLRCRPGCLPQARWVRRGRPMGSASGPPWGGTSRGEGGGPLSPSGWNTHLATAESRRLLTESLVLLNAARQRFSLAEIAWFLGSRRADSNRGPVHYESRGNGGLDVQSRFLHALDGLEGAPMGRRSCPQSCPLPERRAAPEGPSSACSRQNRLRLSRVAQRRTSW